MTFWCIQPTCLDQSCLSCDIALVVISSCLSMLLKSLTLLCNLLLFIISVTALLCHCYTAVLQLDSFQSILCILLTQSE